MTIIAGPMSPPAWLAQPGRALGRIVLLQCECGFTYAAPARKPPPERCGPCNQLARIGKPNAYWAARRARRSA